MRTRWQAVEHRWHLAGEGVGLHPVVGARPVHEKLDTMLDTMVCVAELRTAELKGGSASYEKNGRMQIGEKMIHALAGIRPCGS